MVDGLDRILPAQPLLPALCLLGALLLAGLASAWAADVLDLASRAAVAPSGVASVGGVGRPMVAAGLSQSARGNSAWWDTGGRFAVGGAWSGDQSGARRTTRRGQAGLHRDPNSNEGAASRRTIVPGVAGPPESRSGLRPRRESRFRASLAFFPRP